MSGTTSVQKQIECGSWTHHGYWFFFGPLRILVIFLAQKNWEDLEFYFIWGGGGLPNVDFL